MCLSTCVSILAEGASTQCVGEVFAWDYSSPPVREETLARWLVDWHYGKIESDMRVARKKIMRCKLIGQVPKNDGRIVEMQTSGQMRSRDAYKKCLCGSRKKTKKCHAFEVAGHQERNMCCRTRLLHMKHSDHVIS